MAYAIRGRGRGRISMRALRACRPFLLQALNALRPERVLGVGDAAARSLLNKGNVAVTNLRGRKLVVPGLDPLNTPTVWVTHDPTTNSFVEEAFKRDATRDWTLVPRPGTALPVGRVLAVDTEYTPSGEVISVGLANATEAVCFEYNDIPRAKEILDRTEYLAGHSVAGDVVQLAEAGLPVKREWITGEKLVDSLLLSRMSDENAESFELENLTLDAEYIEPWKYSTKGLFEAAGYDMSKVPADLRQERCRLDAWGAFRNAARLRHAARADLLRYTQRTASILERLTLAGALANRDLHRQYYGEFDTRRIVALDALQKITGALGVPDFKPTNDDQIRDILFKKLALEPLSKTKKGKSSVDKTTLQNIDHPFAKLLMEYNAADKLFAIHGVGLQKLIHPVGQLDGVSLGFLPFHINPLGARTGRRASNNPNSQNWPRALRRLITSRWRDGRIIDCDYSKLEVVLIAWLANDDKLLTAFTVGNGYFDVARELLGIQVDKDTLQYVAVKSVVLGTHYKMQYRKLASDLWNRVGVKLSADYAEHELEAKKLQDRYLRRYAGLRRYMEAREEELLEHGFVTSLVGRVRHLPVPDGENTPGYHHMVNQAVNFPVQSLASDVTASAMLDVEEALLEVRGISIEQHFHQLIDSRRKYLTSSENGVIITPEYETVLFNEVHDSLVGDLHPDHIKRDTEIFVECMRAVKSLKKLCPKFTAPISVSSSSGPYWGSKAA